METKIRIETGRRVDFCVICEYYPVAHNELPCRDCRNTKNPKRFAKEIYINGKKYILEE